MGIGTNRLTVRAKAAIDVFASDKKRHAKAVADFASRHNMVYFKSIASNSSTVPITPGATSSADQVDSNICIGSHDGYDVTYLERTSSVAFTDYPTTRHNWSVLTIDLHSRRTLPAMFIGSNQLSKAFYARLLSTRRELRLLHPDGMPAIKPLHGRGAVLASPAAIPDVHTLIDTETAKKIARHSVPFSIEIEQDSLSIFTDNFRASGHGMDHMLEYGMWLAKLIDERLG